MTAAVRTVIGIVSVTATAAAVAECGEYEKYDDPYPDVSVFKNIAKAVHYFILQVFGIPFGGALLLSYDKR